MTTTPIDNTSITTGFNVDELTEGTLTGKGVFDVLLQTLRLHLDREFTSGRITGTAYATVYSQAITAFLAQAAQYAISKAKLPLELQLLQEQINLTQKQQEQIEAETSRVLYEVNYRLPEEVTLIKHNQDQVLAQTNKITTETEETIQRIEELVPSQIALTNIQKAQVSAQTGEINYRVSTLLPSQTAQNTAQTAQITYTTSYVLPSQVSLTNAQTNNAIAQIGSATAQTALYNQKTVTELAQTTTTPASGSVMGVQNDLMATQKASYLRDAEQKAAKMLIDTWSVRHNAEPGGNPVTFTNRLRNEDIGDAVGKMLTGIGVP